MKDIATRLEMAISEALANALASFVFSTSLSAIWTKNRKGTKMATYALTIFSKFQVR